MISAGPKGARLTIIGASGMVGGLALRYALGQPDVAQIYSIGRRRLGIVHPKLTEVVHSDFSDCSALGPILSDQDGVVYCLGAYTGSVSDIELRTVTAAYTIEFARVLLANSPAATFSFLSGSGADQSGKSRVAFARYKGEAEKALVDLSFPVLNIFRPAYIYPVEPRKEPNAGYSMLRAIYPVFRRVFPNQVIPADDLARVMVQATVRPPHGRGTSIFENKDIRALAATN